jgi:hypothetical protein
LLILLQTKHLALARGLRLPLADEVARNRGARDNPSQRLWRAPFCTCSNEERAE